MIESTIKSDFYCEQILSGRFPVQVVLKTERVIAFHHTKPYFERHIVILSKAHISSLSSVESADPDLAVDLVRAIGEISREIDREFSGCRLYSNVGSY